MPGSGPVKVDDLERAVDDLIEAFDEQMVASRGLFEAQVAILSTAYATEAATLRALIAQKADAVITPLEDTASQLPVLREDVARTAQERLSTEIAIAKMPRRQRLGRHGTL